MRTLQFPTDEGHSLVFVCFTWLGHGSLLALDDYKHKSMSFIDKMLLFSSLCCLVWFVAPF
jgi:hypothetical protein